jgi:hypothetical protein
MFNNTKIKSFEFLSTPKKLNGKQKETYRYVYVRVVIIVPRKMFKVPVKGCIISACLALYQPLIIYLHTFKGFIGHHDICW